MKQSGENTADMTTGMVCEDADKESGIQAQRAAYPEITPNGGVLLKMHLKRIAVR